MRSRLRSFLALTIGAIGGPLVALGDASVWSNGSGVGGATIRVTGVNGVTATRAVTGTGTGEPQVESSADGYASVHFSWGPDWRVQLFGYAAQRGASYGEGGVASLITTSSIDLFGAFEPPGSTGTTFRITGSGYAYGTAPNDESEIHFALLSVSPVVIPAGFIGKADDLVGQGIISPTAILTQFSVSYPAMESLDQWVVLGQVFDQDNVTLLAWIHGKCVSGCIPTLSEWGVAVMALLVLSATTIVIRRRQALAA